MLPALPRPTPVTRLIDVRKHLDLAANTLVYTPGKARALVEAVMRREGGACCAPGST
jgi:hypothetical protein